MCRQIAAWSHCMQSWSAMASSGHAHPGPCRTTWVPSTCWGQCCRPRGSSPTRPVLRCAKRSPSFAYTLWPRATATSSKPCVQKSEADVTRHLQLTVHSLLAVVLVVDIGSHTTEWLLCLHQVQTLHRSHDANLLLSDFLPLCENHLSYP